MSKPIKEIVNRSSYKGSKEIYIGFDSTNRFLSLIPKMEANKDMVIDGNPVEVWHRTSLVFLYDPKQQKYLVQKRAENKGYCPGFYDLGFGGGMNTLDYFGKADLSNSEAKSMVSQSDLLEFNYNSYLTNASRELSEEIGISRSIVDL